MLDHNPIAKPIKKRENKNRYREKIGAERAARFFTGRYSSPYAVYVLERARYIKKQPKLKKNSKVYFAINRRLPTREAYLPLEELAFTTNELLLLCAVYKDLLGLSRRSLRHGAAVLSRSGHTYSYAVEAAEEDMLFLERRAEEIAQVIEDRSDLEDIPLIFKPDPLLLYPTWGWSLRRAVLDQCLARLEKAITSDARIAEVYEDIRSYTSSWWQEKK